MVNWRLMQSHFSSEIWDQELIKFSDYNYYQIFSWGEYKRQFGWTPYRFVAHNSKNKIVAMAQCLLRGLPPSLGIVWCPGGPVGDVSMINEGLRALCMDTIGKKYMYFRFRSLHSSDKIHNTYLIVEGWNIPKRKVSTGLSMVLNLKPSEEELAKKFSKNWRRNLRRFRKDYVSIKHWKNVDIDEILRIYTSMEKYKGLKTQHSKEELIKLFKEFNDKILVYRCENTNGQTVALRSAIICGEKAWDFLAATNEYARKSYASHELLWTLLKSCKERGVRYYDLSGIDPDGNPGVYNFKKGTGATKVKFLGEWEWASSNMLRFGVNLAIKYKIGTF